MTLFHYLSIIGLILLSELSWGQSNTEIDSILNSLQINPQNQEDSLVLADNLTAATDYFYELEYYGQSLDHALAANAIYKQLDLLKAAETFTTISLIYDCFGDYPNGVEASHNALDIYLNTNDSVGIAYSYNDIGVYHYYSGEYTSAFEYLNLSYEYFTKLNDASGISMYYNNTANIYFDQDKLVAALDYYQKAYQLDSAENDFEGMAITLGNMGETYTYLGKFEEADSTLMLSLSIAEKEHDLWGMTNPLRGLANLYQEQGKIDIAIGFTHQSRIISDSIGALPELSESYRMLSSFYQEIGDFESSLQNFKSYKMLEDSIFNRDNAKILHELETKFQTNQKQKEIALLKKDSEITELKHSEEIKEQQSRMIYLILGLIAAGIVGLISYISFVNKKKAHQLLQSQNEIIQEQKNQIQHTFQELEEKNNSIIDSIKYAKLIQYALLKSEEHQSSHLPDHFVLFRPKDIVSGDFYWALEKDNYFYFAVGDCTGHGVPGAFLTMLGISFLNDICNTAEATIPPAKILDTLRSKVIIELSQDGQSASSKDGMDISLAKLNLDTLEMEWAGANNPVWVIRDAEQSFPQDFLDKTERANVTQAETYQLLEIKPEKQPIGYSYSSVPFTNQKVQLNTSDMVYLFSDGYADQFGGPKGKKFKYKPFKSLLGSLSASTMTEQKDRILTEFETWKGDHEQIDDVCVIGIRV